MRGPEEEGKQHREGRELWPKRIGLGPKFPALCGGFAGVGNIDARLLKGPSLKSGWENLLRDLVTHVRDSMLVERVEGVTRGDM